MIVVEGGARDERRICCYPRVTSLPLFSSDERKGSCRRSIAVNIDHTQATIDLSWGSVAVDVTVDVRPRVSNTGGAAPQLGRPCDLVITDSRPYQNFWVAGLEHGPLTLVSTNEELLGRKSSGSGRETEITAVGIHRAYHATSLYPQKLTLTSPTSGSLGRCSSLADQSRWVIRYYY
jgi:hypothetical protein